MPGNAFAVRLSSGPRGQHMPLDDWHHTPASRCFPNFEQKSGRNVGEQDKMSLHGALLRYYRENKWTDLRKTLCGSAADWDASTHGCSFQVTKPFCVCSGGDRSERTLRLEAAFAVEQPERVECLHPRTTPQHLFQHIIKHRPSTRALTPPPFPKVSRCPRTTPPWYKSGN